MDNRTDRRKNSDCLETITYSSKSYGCAGNEVSVVRYALGRRTLRFDAAPALSATNVFAYNQRSEVTNAEMSAATYSYVYDDIGNRKQALSNDVACTYSANSVNQYYAVTNAGAWLPVTHDSDGNMTRLGGRSYAWDAENNMRRSAPIVNSNGNVRVDNVYDYMNRRVSKTVSVLTDYIPFTGIGQPFSAGEWVPSNTTWYVWDGWNVAAEIRIDYGAGTTNVHYYTWGLDLSGSIQGAGGVGGLLADTTCNSQLVTCNTYYPTYDANGNVTEYFDATGAVRGHFEYSAFGETTAKSGDLADTFTHRFSTKPFDAETGISKYQQRDYIPPLGRWASRDPIGESGGMNLLLLAGNQPFNLVDADGRVATKWPLPPGSGFETPPTLQTYSWPALEALIELRRFDNSSKSCDNCCKGCDVSLTLAGSTVSASFVSARAIVSVKNYCKSRSKTCDCALKPEIFWWNCYDKSFVGPSSSFTKYASPGWKPNWWPGDPGRIAVTAYLVYDECQDGKLYTRSVSAEKHLTWTWNYQTSGWVGPVSTK